LQKGLSCLFLVTVLDIFKRLRLFNHAKSLSGYHPIFLDQNLFWNPSGLLYSMVCDMFLYKKGCFNTKVNTSDDISDIPENIFYRLTSLHLNSKCLMSTGINRLPFTYPKYLTSKLKSLCLLVVAI
jgi:hypothetical protein